MAFGRCSITGQTRNMMGPRFTWGSLYTRADKDEAAEKVREAYLDAECQWGELDGSHEFPPFPKLEEAGTTVVTTCW